MSAVPRRATLAEGSVAFHTNGKRPGVFWGTDLPFLSPTLCVAFSNLWRNLCWMVNFAENSNLLIYLVSPPGFEPGTPMWRGLSSS